MPPLLLLVAVGAGAFLGMRWANRDKEVVRKKSAGSTAKNSTKSGSQAKKEAKNLKQDPVSGVYRVDE